MILRNECRYATPSRFRILLDYLELHDGEFVLDCGCGMGFYLMTMGKLRNLKRSPVWTAIWNACAAQREQVPASPARR
jgi:protein-L-isoaspartate O-methyltransferase